MWRPTKNLWNKHLSPPSVISSLFPQSLNISPSSPPLFILSVRLAWSSLPPKQFTHTLLQLPWQLCQLCDSPSLFATCHLVCSSWQFTRLPSSFTASAIHLAPSPLWRLTHPLVQDLSGSSGYSPAPLESSSPCWFTCRFLQ